MFNKRKYFVLDGINNGAAAFITATGEYLQADDGRYFFRNFNIVNSLMKKAGLSIIDVNFHFIIGEENFTVEMRDTYRLLDHYEANISYVDDPTVWIAEIRETFVDSVLEIGYITYADTDKPTKSKSDALAKEKTLCSMVKGTMCEMATYSQFNFSIIEKNNEDIVVAAQMFKSSAKIIVTTNNHLISINEQRRADHKRVIPFSKEFDKFGSLHIYCSIDPDETDESKDMLYNSLMKLIEYLQKAFPEFGVNYTQLPFRGWVHI